MKNCKINKYIFLISSISGMGGAQMYIRNKVVYLRNLGWEVDVIFAYSGRVLITELQQFNHHVEAIAFSAFLYTNTKRCLVVNKITKMINDKDYDEIIIESTCASHSSWGELIADRLHCKHIVYILQEQTELLNQDFANFLLFKHSRKELVGITPYTLYQMFEPIAPILLDASYFLPAYSSNVVEDYDHPLINIIKQKNNDFIIGSIGRIDKPFLFPNLIKLKNFVQCNIGKHYILILMGGETDGNKSTKRKITALFKDVSNIELIITGFLYPLPKRLIRLCDLCFASAGSAQVSHKEGVPTISIDSNDYEPIGVLGYTTANVLFRENEPKVNLETLLSDILIEHKYSKTEAKKINNYPDFSNHIQFVRDSIQTQEYYDIYSIKLTIHEQILRLALFITGPFFYTFLSKLKKNLSK